MQKSYFIGKHYKLIYFIDLKILENSLHIIKYFINWIFYDIFII